MVGVGVDVGVGVLVGVGVEVGVCVEVDVAVALGVGEDWIVGSVVALGSGRMTGATGREQAVKNNKRMAMIATLHMYFTFKSSR